jgi:hypothetical protein
MFLDRSPSAKHEVLQPNMSMISGVGLDALQISSESQLQTFFWTQRHDGHHHHHHHQFIMRSLKTLSLSVKRSLC